MAIWHTLTHKLDDKRTLEVAREPESQEICVTCISEGKKSLEVVFRDDEISAIMQLCINLKFGEGLLDGKYYHVHFKLTEWEAPE